MLCLCYVYVLYVMTSVDIQIVSSHQLYVIHRIFWFLLILCSVVYWLLVKICCVSIDYHIQVHMTLVIVQWFNMNLFLTGSVTSLIIRDLQSNTKYYFKLQAATKAGLSPPTNTIQVYTHDLSKSSFSLCLVFSRSTCWLLNFLSNCFNFEENFFLPSLVPIHSDLLSFESNYEHVIGAVSVATQLVSSSLYCRVWMNKVKCVPWQYYTMVTLAIPFSPWQYHTMLWCAAVV